MRNKATITITDENRDKGKVFVLTEMPAARAEAWAMRALLALIQGGIEVPEGFEHMGMAAMAELGFKALSGLRWEVAEPLLDEMWQCIQIMPNPADKNIVRVLIEQDTEEVTTRLKLRAEVWKLHTGFLKAAAPLNLKNSKATTAEISPTQNT